MASKEKVQRMIELGIKEVRGKNKDLILPFKIAWARQPDMSIHEQRVLIRVMEYVNAQIKGIRISDHLRKIEPTEVTYEISMPTSDAFFRDMTPEEMENELVILSKRMFQYKDERIWWACGYIEHPKVDYGTGMMRFGIYKPFWEVLLNFVSGFREIELNKALMLPTTYSLRFYILMSGKTKPIEMSVEDLKKWLGIDEKLYKDSKGNHRIDNLVARVIEPSKEALDRICPYTFTYEKIRVNPKNPKSKVTGFRFHSVYQPQNRDPELEKNSIMSKVTAKGLIGEDVYKYLIDNFEYTKETIANHKVNIIRPWVDAERAAGGDPILWLSQRRRAAHDAAKGPIAYICGSMQRRTEELANKTQPTLPLDEIPQKESNQTTDCSNDLNKMTSLLTDKFGIK